MHRKVILGIVFSVIFGSTLSMAFDLSPVRAQESPIEVWSDYTLDRDINFADDGFIVKADNATLDLNGHTMIGSGEGTGVNLTEVNAVTVKNGEISNFLFGIYLTDAGNNTITGNTLTNNSYGVWLSESSNYNNITGNNITDNKERGIQHYGSSNNSITENYIANSRVGIDCFSGSSNNTLARNNITENYHHGIVLDFSSNNNVSGNNITDNQNGILLFNSYDNKLRSNSMTNNKYNFGVHGFTLKDFVNDVDISNVVDGKPIHYWINRHNSTAPFDAGYMALVNCTSITVQNLNLTNNQEGVLLAFTTNSTITGNNIINSEYSISAYSSSNNTLFENNATENFNGIWLVKSSNNSINGNNVTENFRGIWLAESSNNSINGNNVTNNSWGIYLSSSSGNTINENNIKANEKRGIELSKSSNNTITENSITENTLSGIFFYESSNNTITGNNLKENWQGIWLYKSSNHTSITENYITDSSDSGIYVCDLSTENNISYNTVRSSRYGIRLLNSTNNFATDNTVSDNTYGVILENSGNNTLIRNHIYGNEYDFGVYGKTLPDFCQDIDTSNWVSAGSIYYIVNQKSLIVDPLLCVEYVGYFAAINSTNITLSCVVLKRNVQGVLLAYTDNSLVEHVETTNNFAGIWLHHSFNNSITGNTISNNIEGIHIANSSNNAIYHNNFIGNADQVKINESHNTWDDGYPSGGNHWSNHTGVDEKSGPNQDQPGSDGIIDAPYVIDENNQDNYPLKESWFNIAIVNILTSKTTTSDTIIYITVVIQIPPDFREPLEINVCSNSTLIATKTTESTDYVLVPLSMIFPIRLNTTLMPKGSYLTSANVTVVSNETYIADNAYVCGTFNEVFLGDINHDGMVNILDISTVAMAYPSWTIREDVNHDGIVNLIDTAIVASAFGSYPGYARWNPDADIDENGKVDILDIGDISGQFGWMVTTDWNQNVDWNNDLVINILDLSAAAMNFGESDP